jgi:Fusaric acid resistance protein-like
MLKSNTVTRWLEQIDPGSHRRIKGLRLVTAYGIAALLGTQQQISGGLPAGQFLSSLAGGFALWASVSEGESTRGKSSRDLLLLCAAAAFGALSMIMLHPFLSGPGRPGSELTLVAGAYLVGYLKRYGVLGAGIGSQIYIGQLLAFSADLKPGDEPTVGVAGVIAALGAIVPRVLSGPAERPVPFTALPPSDPGRPSTSVAMGVQAALAAIIIVAINRIVALEESAWAITACTYVIAGSASGTIERVRRRMVGTLIGVPLGVACLPLALHLPILLWMAAAAAMVVYAIALPERYDVACAAFAFALMVTLAASGVHSSRLLVARIWETLIGCGLGLAAASLVFPLRATSSRDDSSQIGPVMEPHNSSNLVACRSPLQFPWALTPRETEFAQASGTSFSHEVTRCPSQRTSPPVRGESSS